ncbi:hypothetical protein BGY98DRAFT_980812, partial [Russula aff. rugulosa BPL654]
MSSHDHFFLRHIRSSEEVQQRATTLTPLSIYHSSPCLPTDSPHRGGRSVQQRSCGQDTTEAFRVLHRHEVLERPSDSSTRLYSFLFCDHSTVCNLYSTLEGHARGSIAAGDHIVATPSRAALPRESPYLL